MDAILKSLNLEFDYMFTLIVWGLIFARVYVVLLLTPFLGARPTPNRARTAIAIILSIYIYQVMPLPGLEEMPAGKGLIFALFLKEVFFAFAIGLITIMVFHAFEAAGGVVDNQRGGGNAELVVPQLGRVSIFGVYNFWLAVAAFIAIGGHRHFLKAFFLSFKTVPLLAFPAIEGGFSPFLEFIVRLSGDVLVIAVQLAAPVLIAVLLVDLVLGIANKMAPQINVFELGFALRGYMGPLMIYVALIGIVSQMDAITTGMIKSVYELSSLFVR